MARQIVRFGLVGLTQSAGNVAAFACFLALGVRYWLAALAAGALALLVSFFMHKTWTFADTRSDAARRHLRRYVVTYVAATGLGVALLVLLVRAVHAPEVLAQAVAVLVVAPLSYAVQRWWTFA